MAENLPKFKISKQCSLNKSSSHIHKWSLNEVLFVLAVGLLGYRSKALCSVNKAIEEQIRTFIFPGYSSTIKHYPDVVCSGCRRNLYRLKTGDFPSRAWGENISKVIIRTLFKYLI